MYSGNFLFGQIHCGNVELVPNTSVDAYMVFDDLQNTVQVLFIKVSLEFRVLVEDKTVPDPECRWFLRMFVENNTGAGTPN